jgi:hypothetical protein
MLLYKFNDVGTQNINVQLHCVISESSSFGLLAATPDNLFNEIIKSQNKSQQSVSHVHHVRDGDGKESTERSNIQ